TGATPNSATSPKPCSGSCAKPCLSGSTNSRRPSPTISASSTPRIFGSSRDAAIVVSQLAHDEVGVPRDADPNNNIHSLVNQLHKTIGQNELDRDLGIGPHEIAADRT